MLAVGNLVKRHGDRVAADAIFDRRRIRIERNGI
jgi:hypothetical protein